MNITCFVIQFDTLEKAIQLVNNPEQQLAGLSLFAGICHAKAGYPVRVGETSRAWSEGPFWDKIPSRYSDVLLDYCLKGGSSFEIMLSGSESFVLRDARPEQLNALMAKLLEKAPSEANGDEKLTEEEAEKEKKRRKRRIVQDLSEQIVAGLVKVAGLKGKLGVLFEELKSAVQMLTTTPIVIVFLIDPSTNRFFPLMGESLSIRPISFNDGEEFSTKSIEAPPMIFHGFSISSTLLLPQIHSQRHSSANPSFRSTNSSRLSHPSSLTWALPPTCKN